MNDPQTSSVSPPRPLRVAIVQFSPLQPDQKDASAQNLARAFEFVHEAKAKGANLVVFPEYFLQGIISDEKYWGLAQRAFDEDVIAPKGEALTWLESFRLLAVKLDIDIVPGTIVEKTPSKEEGGRPILNNVAHYITRHGKIVGTYKKENLWWPEKDYLSPGSGNHVFETEWGRVGMLICWDLAWPEAFRRLMMQNVEIVIAPTFWGALDAGELGLSHNINSETTYLDSLVVSRAFENEICLIFVNCGGKSEEGFIGRSKVTVPFKGIVGATTTCGEEMAVVDVDLNILADAKKVYGVRRDLITKLRDAGTLPAGVC